MRAEHHKATEADGVSKDGWFMGSVPAHEPAGLAWADAAVRTKWERITRTSARFRLTVRGDPIRGLEGKCSRLFLYWIRR